LSQSQARHTALIVLENLDLSASTAVGKNPISESVITRLNAGIHSYVDEHVLKKRSPT
jgi:hypothetical protein